MIAREEWDEIWSGREASQRLIQTELNSSRFKLIRSVLERKFDSLSRLEVIEIGSGMGKGALALATLGAKPTILDYSEVALEKAAKLFKLCGLKPKLIHCDALKASQEIDQKFDVCLSFGLAEHFCGEERRGMIKAHLDLVREGGVAVISVPNRLCPPYRVAKRVRNWQEIPFTKGELRNIAQKIGAREISVYGCDFIAFINSSVASLWTRGGKESRLTPSLPDIRLGCLDNHFGYALLLFAGK